MASIELVCVTSSLPGVTEQCTRRKMKHSSSDSTLLSDPSKTDLVHPEHGIVSALRTCAHTICVKNYMFWPSFHSMLWTARPGVRRRSEARSSMTASRVCALYRQRYVLGWVRWSGDQMGRSS